MGLFDFFRRARQPRVDGLQLCLLEDEAFARELRRPDSGVGEEQRQVECGRCGSDHVEVIVATDLPNGSAELWNHYPIVIDGWMCSGCSSLAYPRPMHPKQITDMGKRGSELGRQKRWREAQWWFTRLTWSWPDWPNGYVDLAYTLRARRDEETDRTVQIHLARLEAEALQLAIETARAALDGNPDLVDLIAHSHLQAAELDIERRAIDAARASVEAVVALANVSEDRLARASELAEYIEGERWVFADAADVIGPYMDLMGRPGKSTDDARHEVASAVLALEGHYELHPAHWQSIWMAAKGHAALGDARRSLDLWRRAWKDHPDQPDIIREYGLSLLTSRLHDEALRLNRDAVERFPEDSTLWCNLAVVELLCGDLARAKTCCDTSRRLDPSDPVARALETRMVALDPNDLPQSLAELEGRA